MKSIKTKLISLFGVLVTVMCIAIASILYMNAKNALISNVSTTFPKIAEEAAKNFQSRLENDLSSLDLIASADIMSNPEKTAEEKLEFVKSKFRDDSNVVCNAIIDLEGNYLSTDNGKLNDFSDSSFYTETLTERGMVTDPIIYKATNELVIVYAIPIKNAGQTVGVLTEVKKATTYSDYIDYFKLGETGESFILQYDGTYLANKDKDLIVNRVNEIEKSKEDSSLKSLAEIQKKMINRETGLDKYKHDDTNFYLGYAPINKTDWSLGVVIEEAELLSELSDIKRNSIFLGLLFTIVGNLIVYNFANVITNRIRTASDQLIMFSEGDFSKVVQEKTVKYNDEISEMTMSIMKMQESLRDMIGKIILNSEGMDSQSENLSSISEEIASSSQSVSEAIAEVTQGTGNQSESIANIISILNNFSDKLSSMVSEIQDVDVNSREIGKMASGSSKEMDKVNASVKDISDSFKEFYNKIISLGKDVNEINEITRLINSIAEQTNLLALNAAIEAARAGEAGKGFSIVADEIRKLAEQTKTSSENISNLINGVSKNTEAIVQESISIDDKLMEQSGNINNSIQSFGKIITGVDEIIPKIQEVKNAAEDIDRDKDVILNKVDGLSSDAMEISASSEEISASSEEMSATTQEVANSAQILRKMTAEMKEEINKFKV